MTINRFKPVHNIYYNEFSYEHKKIDIILNIILNILNIIESNNIQYDIKVDKDFKIFFLYCYPKNLYDEELLSNNHMIIYSLSNSVDKFVDRFRKNILKNDFDEYVDKEYIESILSTNKFNL